MFFRNFIKCQAKSLPCKHTWCLKIIFVQMPFLLKCYWNSNQFFNHSFCPLYFVYLYILPSAAFYVAFWGAREHFLFSLAIVPIIGIWMLHFLFSITFLSTCYKFLPFSRCNIYYDLFVCYFFCRNFYSLKFFSLQGKTVKFCEWCHNMPLLGTRWRTERERNTP